MIQVTINKKSITPRIRVHFFSHYSATGPIPLALVADNIPFKELYADFAYQIGFVDLFAMTTAIDASGSDCSRTQEVYAGLFPLPYLCHDTSLWVALELLDGISALSNGQLASVKVKSMPN